MQIWIEVMVFVNILKEIFAVFMKSGLCFAG